MATEDILKAFDRDGDEVLEGRELKGRPDLLRAFDSNGDQKAERAEIARMIDQLDRVGVDALPDDFLGRWDLVTPAAGGDHFLAQTFAVALLISAVLWAVASHGKHIGWIGFLLAAVLTWLGAPA